MTTKNKFENVSRARYVRTYVCLLSLFPRITGHGHAANLAGWTICVPEVQLLAFITGKRQ